MLFSFDCTGIGEMYVDTPIWDSTLTVIILNTEGLYYLQRFVQPEPFVILNIPVCINTQQQDEYCFVYNRQELIQKLIL